MMLIASQILLWTVVILLSLTVVVLARQIGVLHERISPVGALALGQGPQVGEQAPVLRALSLARTAVDIGGARPEGRVQMLMFVAPSCPVCKQLMPTIRRVAQAEGADLLFVGDGDDAQHRQMALRHGIAADAFINDGQVGRAYRVGKLPYGVVIDATGEIIGQGLVNTREHLESLFATRETGFGDLQEYLHARHLGELDSKTDETING